MAPHLRAPALDCGQAVLHHLLSQAVQCAGGLVKHQDGRLLQHSTRKRHALLLTTRQPQPALACSEK
jgi:hypothetical protein